MNEDWKRWAGRTVDGIFPLQRYLGETDHTVVFLTEKRNGAGGPESAAIKLIPAEADSEKQLGRWRTARDLEHPNLIRIFEAGRAELDGVALLYAVEEYAEENLAQILPERALTAEEARMMLPPVLGALQYLHGKGLVHGRIQPSNILAIGDQVKVSSDSVGAPGEMKATTGAYDPPEASAGADSAAGDVWRLGMTLVEVLTQRLPDWGRLRTGAPEIPAAVPEPFREIAGGCLQVDAGTRWTIAQIAARLGEGRAATHEPETTAAASAASRENIVREKPSQPTESAKWPYWLLLAAVVVVVLFLMTRAKLPRTASETPAENPQTSGSQTEPSSTQPQSPASGERPVAKSDDGILRRVMPEVSPSARRTIQGTIKIRLRVDVDAAGNVTTAKLESGAASKYFSRVALEAAREWKFSPAQGEASARQWKLQFALNRARTEASAVRVKR